MILYSRGSPTDRLTPTDLRDGLFSALDRLGRKSRVLAVPPDFTRVHSQAGILTEQVWQYYGDRLTDVLPATGTHFPMTGEEIAGMFGAVPRKLFRAHDWRNGLRMLGTVPAAVVREVSEHRVDYDIPVQIDPLVADGGHDLILSIGQVVPHEVIGMANQAKNIFVGAGGSDVIHKTHFLGAAFGMERIMGRADTPVRRVVSYAAEHFARHLPIIYVLTVVGREPGGGLVVRGLCIGDDLECFYRAAELSLQVNFELLAEPLRRVVVYLDPGEFKSTWLGNKSIYRTRMAIADGGELIVLAPGVSAFGEDEGIDRLIRAYGYAGTPAVLEHVRRSQELRANLSAAAHLIHGSTEGRFSVTYCPGGLTRQEIEGVGFRYGHLQELLGRYDPAKLHEGMNTLPDGEQVFFIANPALGLWAHRDRFSMLWH
jgi:nickel-dependent lactate racemase